MVVEGGGERNHMLILRSIWINRAPGTIYGNDDNDFTTIDVGHFGQNSIFFSRNYTIFVLF